MEQAPLRTVKLDPDQARNYEPAFRAAIAEQPDDAYRIVMEFFIDGELSETWTWTPAMTGYVEQEVEGTVKRFQIAWARKATVTLLEIVRDDSGGTPRFVARWSNAAGQVQDKELIAADPEAAAEEAEGFIYRMAYM